MLAALMTAMNRTLTDTVDRAANVLDLDPLIKLSGGMSTPEIIALKKRIFAGFDFEVVHNCSIIGNVRLMQRYAEDVG